MRDVQAAERGNGGAVIVGGATFTFFFFFVFYPPCVTFTLTLTHKCHVSFSPAITTNEWDYCTAAPTRLRLPLITHSQCLSQTGWTGSGWSDMCEQTGVSVSCGVKKMEVCDVTFLPSWRTLDFLYIHQKIHAGPVYIEDSRS